MKRRLITAALLLIAVTLYLAGYSGAGTVAFAAGAGFETWFWVRLLCKRPLGQSD